MLYILIKMCNSLMWTADSGQDSRSRHCRSSYSNSFRCTQMSTTVLSTLLYCTVLYNTEAFKALRKLPLQFVGYVLLFSPMFICRCHMNSAYVISLFFSVCHIFTPAPPPVTPNNYSPHSFALSFCCFSPRSAADIQEQHTDLSSSSGLLSPCDPHTCLSYEPHQPSGT